MDINALRVFNSLYKLGIAEQEFKEIEEEQKNTERTGLSIKAVSGNKIIGISHDQKHKIIIKEVRGKIIKPKSRVLFKTLITFEDLPKQIYTLHQIAQYRALDTEIKHIANNLDELKDRVCDRFADEYPKEVLGSMYEDVYGSYDNKERNSKLRKVLIIEQLKALFWLFDEKFDELKPTIPRVNISKILKVFSRNNRRVALIQLNEKWLKGSSLNMGWKETIERVVFKIVTFTPRHPQYNYVNPNREIFFYNDQSIWLDDDLCGKVTAGELTILMKGDYNNFLLSSDDYNEQKSNIRIELMNARRKEQEDKARNQLVKSIKKQFSKGKVVRQGITFTKKSISYEGISIKGKNIGEYLYQNDVVLLERPDFMEICKGYIEYMLRLEIDYDCYSDYGEVRNVTPRFEGKEKIIINNNEITIEKSPYNS